MRLTIISSSSLRPGLETAFLRTHARFPTALFDINPGVFLPRREIETRPSTAESPPSEDEASSYYFGLPSFPAGVLLEWGPTEHYPRNSAP